MDKVIRRVFNFLAKLGLVVRDDPPKVIDVDRRVWGEPAGGWALSLADIPVLDPAGLPNVSVVLRNVSGETRSLTVPGWIFFYSLDVRALDGTPLALSGFGRQLLKPERRTERLDVSLAPGAVVEAQIPLGSLYNLRPKEHCRVRASCEVDGVLVGSNEIAL